MCFLRFKRYLQYRVLVIYSECRYLCIQSLQMLKNFNNNFFFLVLRSFLHSRMYFLIEIDSDIHRLFSFHFSPLHYLFVMSGEKSHLKLLLSFIIYVPCFTKVQNIFLMFKRLIPKMLKLHNYMFFVLISVFFFCWNLDRKPQYEFSW